MPAAVAAAVTAAVAAAAVIAAAAEEGGAEQGTVINPESPMSGAALAAAAKAVRQRHFDGVPSLSDFLADQAWACGTQQQITRPGHGGRQRRAIGSFSADVLDFLE